MTSAEPSALVARMLQRHDASKDVTGDLESKTNLELNGTRVAADGRELSECRRSQL